jgi:hypothetical protein
VTELDPYAVLGVPRTATREEIARAYRRMAKRFHPDAATGAPHASMARINEAWRILSDAARRSRWDRVHTVVQPAPWSSPAPVRVPRRPAPEPVSGRDSGWLAVAIVLGAALVIGIVMAGIGLASGAPAIADDPRVTIGPLSFTNPSDWEVATGEEGQPSEHRVLAHLATYDVTPAEPCTDIADPCGATADAVPPGEASIIVVGWEVGVPPVPEPLQQRAFGLNAQRIIGDQPAAFQLQRAADGALAWWQLSPPGFPDRWVEVTAYIGGQRREQDEMLSQIEGWLAAVEFAP